MENDNVRYRISEQDDVAVLAPHPSDAKSASRQKMPPHFSPSEVWLSSESWKADSNITLYIYNLISLDFDRDDKFYSNYLLFRVAFSLSLSTLPNQTHTDFRRAISKFRCTEVVVFHRCEKDAPLFLLPPCFSHFRAAALWDSRLRTSIEILTLVLIGPSRLTFEPEPRKTENGARALVRWSD